MIEVARKRLGVGTECREQTMVAALSGCVPIPTVPVLALGIPTLKGRSLKGLHSRRTPHDSQRPPSRALGRKEARLAASAAGLGLGTGTNGLKHHGSGKRPIQRTRKKNEPGNAKRREGPMLGCTFS
jgi:hypothetical protein